MTDSLPLPKEIRKQFTLPESADAQTARKQASQYCGYATFISAAYLYAMLQISSMDLLSKPNDTLIERVANMVTALLVIGTTLFFAAIIGGLWRLTIGWLLLHTEAVHRGEYLPPANKES